MKTRALLLLSLTCPLAAQGKEGEDDGTRFFAIPMARDTHELAITAREHLSAGRHDDALAALQELLDEHAGEVLPASWRENTDSTFAGYPGAGEWALARMYELPAEARRDYCTRYEPRAAEALEHVLAAPERAALVRITRQFPLAPSAVRAWWCLGDLELEGGHLEEARLAWQAAEELALRLGLPASEPGRARLEQLAAARPHDGAPPSTGGSLPHGDSEPWVTPLDLAPFVLRGQNTSERSNLLPLSHGGRLFVCSTLRLFALDPFTGALLWQSERPTGWLRLTPAGADKLFAGINWDQLMLSPAAGDNVVVAAMQTPFSEDDNEEWQTIEIMRAIPERRLHAFDATTGRELWNHDPPLTWDEGRPKKGRESSAGWRWDGSGSYAQRMMVAGSPVVAGARVLVPCYRMQGRIDYHVACYELTTGNLLWNTPVISGQRERNMFGRGLIEFSAVPVVVVEDRVVAQTELGTVAALDLFTGRILWQSTYNQVSLPKTKNYGPPRREVVWRLAPPVVVGDLLVATPSDSKYLVAFRLADGHVPWSYDETNLRKLARDGTPGGFDLLVGADADTVYLSGSKLCALQKPGGLASLSYFSKLWTQPLQGDQYMPRAILTPDALLVPEAEARLAFDRRTGEARAALSGSWKSAEVGNLLVEDGALYSLSTAGMAGFLDWQALLGRARRASAGEAPVAALRSAAALFQRRGELALDELDLDQALASLGEASALREALRRRNPDPEPPHAEVECLLALARAQSQAGRVDEALLTLARGRELGAGGADLAALLFAEERILRTGGGTRRVAVLDRLEEACPDLPLPAMTRSESMASWLAGMPAPLERQPLPAIPTALWVRVERAGERVRAGALGQALDDLHAALQQGRGIELARGRSLAGLVRERIATVLALPGGPEAYAPFEERALSLFTAAAGDTQRLEQVAQLYPHSQAAGQALEARLDRAVVEDDAATVTALASTALASGALTTSAETRILLRLARVLGARGNRTLEQALLCSLARTDPRFVSDLPQDSGRTLAELAAASLDEPAEQAAAPVVFDEKVMQVGPVREGTYEFLGSIPPSGPTAEGAPRELHAYATREGIQAFSSAAPEEPLWTVELEQPIAGGRRACAVSAGHLYYGTSRELACLDERGVRLWAHATEGEAPRQLIVWSGVLLAELRPGHVLVLDAHLGYPLWEKELGASSNWSGALVAGGRAVFFSERHGLAVRALVFDLFRGRVLSDFPLAGFEAKGVLGDTAWISGEHLITADFERRPAQISAIDLEGGKRAWTVELGRDEELFALPTWAGRCFPVTLATSLGNAAGNGGVYELDEAAGTLRRILPLRAGERVMGLAAEERCELAAPFLFTYFVNDNERSVPIRAIRLLPGRQDGLGARGSQALEPGEAWKWSLPVSAQEFNGGRLLPMPAVSADSVAICYQKRRTAGNSSDESILVFVDREEGRHIGTQSLDSAFAGASALELRGLGATLFVVGKSRLPRGACLVILGSGR